MNVKSRHHLREDAIAEIEEALAGALGVELSAERFEQVAFEDSDREVVLVDGEPLVLYVESEGPGASSGRDDSGAAEPFLTVQGLNAYPPERRVVTVDAGAVSFVSDGADVMRPGITAADEAIEEGDLVGVNEESHGKYLAVGRARTGGEDMLGDSGKVVTSVHHVGDDLYAFSP